jgi:hypothetical protein
MLTVLTQKPLFSKSKPADAHHLRRVQPRVLAAARRATNSLYRCAAPITAQSIAPATSARGGSTRSKPGASFVDADILRPWTARRPDQSRFDNQHTPLASYFT